LETFISEISKLEKINKTDHSGSDFRKEEQSVGKSEQGMDKLH
jgi:hypothetical protein